MQYLELYKTVGVIPRLPDNLASLDGTDLVEQGQDQLVCHLVREMVE